MQLPLPLQQAIQKEAEELPLHKLKTAQERLSLSYRNITGDKKGLFLKTPEEKIAYLMTRMPATYAAVRKVLEEVKKRIPNLNIQTLLDLGSGPGTVLWAAHDLFPLLKATLLEKDAEMIVIGKRLSPFSFTEWIHQDIVKMQELPKADLVVISYAMGELDSAEQTALLAKAWEAASQALIVIEPGTPYGFSSILQARTSLIEWGASLAAPCPGHMKCPMEGKDWCHFSVRLERSSLHRQMKTGELGYEDEKFSYMAASKLSVHPVEARILRHPQQRSGHVNFVLCTLDGKQNKVVSRREGESYHAARKLEWGDGFE